jgi:5-methylcytosine-specific restriction endonuclease McrA
MTEMYQFDAERFRLGNLCQRGHDYSESGFSLRYKSGSCVECAKITSRTNANKPSTKACRTKWKAANREKLRQLGLTARGTLPIKSSAAIPKGNTGNYRKSIRDAGKLPTVAELVIAEQRRYWEENPEAREEHRRQWNRERRLFRYMTNPALRTYNREKSKRRKAAMRSGHVVQVTSAQLRERFAEFSDTCAYCGAGCHLHIEHVVPISQGGTHTLGNIVPACQACNYSKRAKPVEEWYRCQPFFSVTRWRKLGQVLGWGCGSPSQLTLL